VTEASTRIYADTYVDSVLLMTATRAMSAAPGVEWAAALMATPANLDDLRDRGFDVPSARANDLILALRAGSPDEAKAGLDAGHDTLASAAHGGATGAQPADIPKTLDDAVAVLAEANVAIVSVPGPYAALEAHKALSKGLHVLLFSDNVPIADEVALKERGAALGLLVMGPGAGTAMLGGTGLGFANAVRAGRVGVVAAAGTGAQEVMCLLDRWGEGVSQAIGVGGRDLSSAVGGTMAGLALRALATDPATEAILLVSKPPSPEVVARLLGAAGGKPLVAALVGVAEPVDAPTGVVVTDTLEEGVLQTLRCLGTAAPDPAEGLASLASSTLAGLEAGRHSVLGLFSGGTLCYESMVVMSRHLGPIRSNAPLDHGWGLPAPSGSHVCLDLGEEEYTRGRPHPMIDPSDRAQRIGAAPDDRSVGVVLIDVVLGYGGHPDPASVLAPACRSVTGRPGGPRVVAYVLGTEADPQVRSKQCAAFEEAGCLLAPTATRAALLAAAIAARNPSIAGAP
jgi:FdrA protein